MYIGYCVIHRHVKTFIFRLDALLESEAGTTSNGSGPGASPIPPLTMKTHPSQTTTPPSSAPSPRLDESRVLDCEPFHYPWDDWEQWALAQGLDPRVAGQARLLIREAFNHGWEDWLKIICGWRDDGRALLELGQRAPERALRQWGILMRTDGFRGDHPPLSRSGEASHPQTGDWTWGYLRFDARRLHDRLLLQATIYTLAHQPQQLPEPRTAPLRTTNHQPRTHHAPHS